MFMKREDNLTTFGRGALMTGTDNLCIKGVIGIYNCKQALVKNPGPDVLFYCSVIIMAPRKKRNELHIYESFSLNVSRNF